MAQMLPVFQPPGVLIPRLRGLLRGVTLRCHMTQDEMALVLPVFLPPGLLGPRLWGPLVTLPYFHSGASRS